MTVYTEILGNANRSEEWKDKIANANVDYVFLDQWTAQKSRFLAKGTSGEEYPVALKRHTQVVDGDVISYDPETNKAVVLKIELNPVLVIDLASLSDKDPETIIRRSVELGHAIGNQHWPAVVKGTKVYVPLTVDKKVMLSVMETHHLEGVSFEFQTGLDIIPYLAPHEIRRLFGGASHESHVHGEPGAHHHHPTTHVHFDENGIAHEHTH
ncbi:MAG: urease accessory protein UreE [Bacteroidales bacterium]|nr:urease accessory protein UreE [Bacteroidales bacterium]MDE7466007.1 urease accessory protein UreE [Muribaculaceae bacterium]